MDKYGRHRIRSTFWCNIMKVDEREVNFRLKQLKRKRKHNPTIIKALRLYFSLMDGDFSVLRNEFPDMYLNILLSSIPSQEQLKVLSEPVLPPQPQIKITKETTSCDASRNFLTSLVGAK